MRIALAQLNYIIGDFDGNTDKMVDAIQWAKTQKADIICFSELAVCGYPPRDFLEFRDFIQLSQSAIKRLQSHSQDMAIVVGAPRINPILAGKDLHNSAFFLYNNEILGVADKALLPTYDIFDEYRYFEPGTVFKPISFKGKKIAVTICEDIWDVQGKHIEVGIENPMYRFNPLDEMEEKFDFIINISASPFSYIHAKERLDVVQANVEAYNVPMFYCNQVGAQTEIIFDGGSLVVSPNKQVYDEMPYFEEHLAVYDLEDVLTGKEDRPRQKIKTQLIHDSIVLGLKDYFGKLKFSSAIIGLSGGIDSAVTTALAVEALGPDNVRVLLMPSQFSSDHSVEDARLLAENLGIQYDIIPIKDVYDAFDKKLHPIFNDLPFNVAEENIQARVRGTLLMAVSNKFGNILLNTTNKSEMAVGYGTLYGDLCGGLSVIGDVYKMEVYELARYINRHREIIPENSISKPPSAELRPNQKDSDSLPDYDILDQILFRYIEERKGPDEIIKEGFDEKVVARALSLVNRNEFKRYQTAPVLRVSPKAFGVGRRVPIVGRYLS